MLQDNRRFVIGLLSVPALATDATPVITSPWQKLPSQDQQHPHIHTASSYSVPDNGPGPPVSRLGQETDGGAEATAPAGAVLKSVNTGGAAGAPGAAAVSAHQHDITGEGHSALPSPQYHPFEPLPHHRERRKRLLDKFALRHRLDLPGEEPIFIKKVEENDIKSAPMGSRAWPVNQSEMDLCLHLPSCKAKEGYLMLRFEVLLTSGEVMHVEVPYKDYPEAPACGHLFTEPLLNRIRSKIRLRDEMLVYPGRDKNTFQMVVFPDVCAECLTPIADREDEALICDNCFDLVDPGCCGVEYLPDDPEENWCCRWCRKAESFSEMTLEGTRTGTVSRRGAPAATARTDGAVGYVDPDTASTLAAPSLSYRRRHKCILGEAVQAIAAPTAGVSEGAVINIDASELDADADSGSVHGGINMMDTVAVAPAGHATIARDTPAQEPVGAAIGTTDMEAPALWQSQPQLENAPSSLLPLPADVVQLQPQEPAPPLPSPPLPQQPQELASAPLLAAEVQGAAAPPLSHTLLQPQQPQPQTSSQLQPRGTLLPPTCMQQRHRQGLRSPLDPQVLPAHLQPLPRRPIEQNAQEARGAVTDVEVVLPRTSVGCNYSEAAASLEQHSRLAQQLSQAENWQLETSSSPSSLPPSPPPLPAQPQTLQQPIPLSPRPQHQPQMADEPSALLRETDEASATAAVGPPGLGWRWESQPCGDLDGGNRSGAAQQAISLAENVVAAVEVAEPAGVTEQQPTQPRTGSPSAVSAGAQGASEGGFLPPRGSFVEQMVSAGSESPQQLQGLPPAQPQPQAGQQHGLSFLSSQLPQNQQHQFSWPPPPSPSMCRTLGFTAAPSDAAGHAHHAIDSHPATAEGAAGRSSTTVPGSVSQPLQSMMMTVEVTAGDEEAATGTVSESIRAAAAAVRETAVAAQVTSLAQVRAVHALASAAAVASAAIASEVRGSPPRPQLPLQTHTPTVTEVPLPAPPPTPAPPPPPQGLQQASGGFLPAGYGLTWDPALRGPAMLGAVCASGVGHMVPMDQLSLQPQHYPLHGHHQQAVPYPAPPPVPLHVSQQQGGQQPQPQQQLSRPHQASHPLQHSPGARPPHEQRQEGLQQQQQQQQQQYNQQVMEQFYAQAHLQQYFMQHGTLALAAGAGTTYTHAPMGAGPPPEPPQPHATPPTQQAQPRKATARAPPRTTIAAIAAPTALGRSSRSASAGVTRAVAAAAAAEMYESDDDLSNHAATDDDSLSSQEGHGDSGSDYEVRGRGMRGRGSRGLRGRGSRGRRRNQGQAHGAGGRGPKIRGRAVAAAGAVHDASVDQFADEVFTIRTRAGSKAAGTAPAGITAAAALPSHAVPEAQPFDTQGSEFGRGYALPQEGYSEAAGSGAHVGNSYNGVWRAEVGIATTAPLSETDVNVGTNGRDALAHLQALSAMVSGRMVPPIGLPRLQPAADGEMLPSIAEPVPGLMGCNKNTGGIGLAVDSAIIQPTLVFPLAPPQPRTGGNAEQIAIAAEPTAATASSEAQREGILEPEPLETALREEHEPRLVQSDAQAACSALLTELTKTALTATGPALPLLPSSLSLAIATGSSAAAPVAAPCPEGLSCELQPSSAMSPSHDGRGATEPRREGVGLRIKIRRPPTVDPSSAGAAAAPASLSPTYRTAAAEVRAIVDKDVDVNTVTAATFVPDMVDAMAVSAPSPPPPSPKISLINDGPHSPEAAEAPPGEVPGGIGEGQQLGTAPEVSPSELSAGHLAPPVPASPSYPQLQPPQPPPTFLGAPSPPLPLVTDGGMVATSAINLSEAVVCQNQMQIDALPLAVSPGTLSPTCNPLDGSAGGGAPAAQPVTGIMECYLEDAEPLVASKLARSASGAGIGQVLSATYFTVAASGIVGNVSTATAVPAVSMKMKLQPAATPVKQVQLEGISGALHPQLLLPSVLPQPSQQPQEQQAHQQASQQAQQQQQQPVEAEALSGKQLEDARAPVELTGSGPSTAMGFSRSTATESARVLTILRQPDAEVAAPEVEVGPAVAPEGFLSSEAGAKKLPPAVLPDRTDSRGHPSPLIWVQPPPSALLLPPSPPPSLAAPPIIEPREVSAFVPERSTEDTLGQAIEAAGDVEGRTNGSPGWCSSGLRPGGMLAPGAGPDLNAAPEPVSVVSVASEAVGPVHDVSPPAVMAVVECTSHRNGVLLAAAERPAQQATQTRQQQQQLVAQQANTRRLPATMPCFPKADRLPESVAALLRPVDGSPKGGTGASTGGTAQMPPPAARPTTGAITKSKGSRPAPLPAQLSGCFLTGVPPLARPAAAGASERRAPGALPGNAWPMVATTAKHVSIRTGADTCGRAGVGMDPGSGVGLEVSGSQQHLSSSVAPKKSTAAGTTATAEEAPTQKASLPSPVKNAAPLATGRSAGESPRRGRGRQPKLARGSGGGRGYGAGSTNVKSAQQQQLLPQSPLADATRHGAVERQGDTALDMSGDRTPRNTRHLQEGRGTDIPQLQPPPLQLDQVHGKPELCEADRADRLTTACTVPVVRHHNGNTVAVTDTDIIGGFHDSCGLCAIATAVEDAGRERLHATASVARSEAHEDSAAATSGIAAVDGAVVYGEGQGGNQSVALVPPPKRRRLHRPGAAAPSVVVPETAFNALADTSEDVTNKTAGGGGGGRPNRTQSRARGRSTATTATARQYGLRQRRRLVEVTREEQGSEDYGAQAVARQGEGVAAAVDSNDGNFGGAGLADENGSGGRGDHTGGGEGPTRRTAAKRTANKREAGPLVAAPSRGRRFRDGLVATKRSRAAAATAKEQDNVEVEEATESTIVITDGTVDDGAVANAEAPSAAAVDGSTPWPADAADRTAASGEKGHGEGRVRRRRKREDKGEREDKQNGEDDGVGDVKHAHADEELPAKTRRRACQSALVQRIAASAPKLSSTLRSSPERRRRKVSSTHLTHSGQPLHPPMQQHENYTLEQAAGAAAAPGQGQEEQEARELGPGAEAVRQRHHKSDQRHEDLTGSPGPHQPRQMPHRQLSLRGRQQDQQEQEAPTTTAPAAHAAAREIAPKMPGTAVQDQQQSQQPEEDRGGLQRTVMELQACVAAQAAALADFRSRMEQHARGLEERVQLLEEERGQLQARLAEADKKAQDYTEFVNAVTAVAAASARRRSYLMTLGIDGQPRLGQGAATADALQTHEAMAAAAGPSDPPLMLPSTGNHGELLTGNGTRGGGGGGSNRRRADVDAVAGAAPYQAR